MDASGVPEPPWRLGRRSAPRAPLTRDAIVEAALRVLDAEGMEALSMRRVGNELGAGAASLYWHVRNKDELFQLIVDRVTGEATVPEPDPSHWQEQLRAFAMQMRAVLNSHRDVARLSLGRIPSGSTLALYTEWLFTLLKPVGIPERVIAYLGDFFGLYVGAYTFEESLGVASPTGENLPPEQIIAMFRDYMMSLPEERFPHTRAAANFMFVGGPDERFEFGVDLAIRGLETYANSAPRRGDRPPAD